MKSPIEEIKEKIRNCDRFLDRIAKMLAECLTDPFEINISYSRPICSYLAQNNIEFEYKPTLDDVPVEPNRPDEKIKAALFYGWGLPEFAFEQQPLDRELITEIVSMVGCQVLGLRGLIAFASAVGNKNIESTTIFFRTFYYALEGNNLFAMIFNRGISCISKRLLHHTTFEDERILVMLPKDNSN